MEGEIIKLENTNHSEKSADHLIQSLEDGTISPEDFEFLMAWMRRDPEVYALYMEHMETVALLKLAAESRVEMGMMPVSDAMIHQQRRRSGIVSLSYGLAAILILSIGFLVFHVSQRPVVEREWIVMDASMGSNYSVVRSEDDFRDAKSLQVGDKVILNQGVVRFTFPSGVEAIVEGPSELELISDFSLKMKQGQAWFRVPEDGHGFTVQTDRVNVVDLGTEFGVWFDANENLQVHVAKGKVRVEPVLKVMAKFELVEEKAMTFDVYGRGQSVPIASSLFRQKFTHSMPYLHWSFDELVDGEFEVDGTMPGVGGYPAKLRHLKDDLSQVDITEHQVEGKHGRAFSMNGRGLFAETAFPGIGGNSPRTLSMWIRHRRENLNSGIVSPYCVWGRGEAGAIWKVSLKKEDAVDKLFTVSYASSHSTDLSDGITNEWVHVASVYTGRQLENGYPEIIHYINGVRQQVNNNHTRGGAIVNTDISSEKAKPVRFGASLSSNRDWATLDGDIDEVYLFRGVLNDAQIKELMVENRLGFFRE